MKQSERIQMIRGVSVQVDAESNGENIFHLSFIIFSLMFYGKKKGVAKSKKKKVTKYISYLKKAFLKSVNIEFIRNKLLLF